MTQHPRHEATPTVRTGCSIALFDGSAVLMIQRALPPFARLWSLPGGGIEPGESAREAICREVWEELGLIVPEPQQVTMLTVGEGDVAYRLTVFAAFLPRRAPVPSSEIAKWDWLVPAELARYRTTPHLGRIVARCLARLDETGP